MGMLKKHILISITHKLTKLRSRGFTINNIYTLFVICWPFCIFLFIKRDHRLKPFLCPGNLIRFIPNPDYIICSKHIYWNLNCHFFRIISWHPTYTIIANLSWPSYGYYIHILIIYDGWVMKVHWFDHSLHAMFYCWARRRVMRVRLGKMGIAIMCMEVVYPRVWVMWVRLGKMGIAIMCMEVVYPRIWVMWVF